MAAIIDTESTRRRVAEVVLESAAVERAFEQPRVKGLMAMIDLTDKYITPNAHWIAGAAAITIGLVMFAR